MGHNWTSCGLFVATRRNDYDLGVAKRDTWTVAGVRDDGTMHLVGTAGKRELPLRYAVNYVELAYASTAYEAQGETTRTAHLALSEHTGAASAYVAMTRGRETNTAHLVAEDLDDARQRWTLSFARNRTDLGPAHAARLAAQEAAKYEPYVEPHHLDNYDDPAPVTCRRPEPIPTFSRRCRGRPRHRSLSRDSQPVSASSAARAWSTSGASNLCQAGRSTDNVSQVSSRLNWSYW